MAEQALTHTRTKGSAVSEEADPFRGRCRRIISQPPGFLKVIAIHTLLVTPSIPSFFYNLTHIHAFKMKSVSCNEISGLSCDFVSEADSAEEAKRGLILHGMTDHKDLLDSLSEEELMKMMEHLDEVLSKE